MSMVNDEKLKELTELSGGNNLLLIDLLEKFVVNAAKYIEKAKSGINNKNKEDVQFAIHTLKGSSMSLGLSKLGELLTRMNADIKNGIYENCMAEILLVEQMVAEVDKYRKTIT